MAKKLELKRGKLTKKFLMELPTGLYLVSNVAWKPDQPFFAEKVSALTKREEQWRRIVEAGVSQKLCRVFKAKKDHKTWAKPMVEKFQAKFG